MRLHRLLRVDNVWGLIQLQLQRRQSFGLQKHRREFVEHRLGASLVHRFECLDLGHEHGVCLLHESSLLLLVDRCLTQIPIV